MTRLIYDNIANVEVWTWDITKTILQDGMGEDIDIFFLREMIRQEIISNANPDINLESSRRQFRSLIGDAEYTHSYNAKYYAEHLYRNIINSFKVNSFEYLVSKES